MAIKQKTPQYEVDSYLDENIRRIEKAILYNLAVIGEECIKIARSTTKAGKNYKDQTGNLRSSVGYVIVSNGHIVQSSDFKTVKAGSTGSSEGETFAREIAGKYKTGYVLILVSGMNYAVHVQNMGYDVQASAELYAEETVQDLIKQLGL